MPKRLRHLDGDAFPERDRTELQVFGADVSWLTRSVSFFAGSRAWRAGSVSRENIPPVFLSIL